MKDQNLAKKLKENLEKIPGISNVRLHSGIFRGSEQKPAYVEYHLTAPEFEDNSHRIYCIIDERIRMNCPSVSTEYTKPETNGQANLRRINIDFNIFLIPSEKEQKIIKVAQEFNDVIENYLLKKDKNKK